MWPQTLNPAQSSGNFILRTTIMLQLKSILRGSLRCETKPQPASFLAISEQCSWFLYLASRLTDAAWVTALSKGTIRSADLVPWRFLTVWCAGLVHKFHCGAGGTLIHAIWGLATHHMGSWSVQCGELIREMRGADPCASRRVSCDARC